MNRLAGKNFQTQILKEMKKIGIILSMFLIATACTISQAQETQMREVTGYSGIDVSEGIKVILSMGDKERVEVTASEDIIDNVITEISGDNLKIYIKGNNKWRKGHKIEVKVMAKEINMLNASSGSSIQTTNTIKTNELKIKTSSGASASVDCKAEYTFTESSSGASLKIRGVSTHFAAKASSGASISGQDMKAKKVKADVSSGGSIKAHADEEIKAEASSGGSVKYSGSPKMKDIHKSSGGSVKPY